MREVVLDTETTGLDPDGGDRIIEIACVELIDQLPTGAVYHQLINPERDVPAEAVAVHGISNERLASEPVFAATVDAFVEFIGDSPLVIHNAVFDMRFINCEFGLCGRPAIPSNRAVDTLAIARQKFPGAPASLDALCKRFEIDLAEREKHNALVDARLLARVYLELVGGAQRGFDLTATRNIASPAGSAGGPDRPYREPRPHAPTPEELAAHAGLVAQLGDKALWGSEGPGQDA
ncbi:MAG: DNA polymerase III subunit epsilon [Acetobacterales bacterium]